MKIIILSLSLTTAVGCFAGCHTADRPAEYPLDLTEAEVAAIPANQLYQQSDSVLVQWASMNPHELDVWGWIRRRHQDGGITPEQASQLVDVTIAWMNDTRPNGYKRGLGLRGDLLGDIERRDGLTDEQLRQLVDALHGTELAIEPESYNGRVLRNFEITYGSVWTLPFTTQMPYQMFWQLDEVHIDGERVEVINPHYHPEFVRFRLEVGDLPPGEYTVEARLAVGVADWRLIRGINRRESTPADWPKMRLRWQVDGAETIIVEPAEERKAVSP